MYWNIYCGAHEIKKLQVTPFESTKEISYIQKHVISLGVFLFVKAYRSIISNIDLLLIIQGHGSGFRSIAAFPNLSQSRMSCVNQMYDGHSYGCILSLFPVREINISHGASSICILENKVQG